MGPDSIAHSATQRATEPTAATDAARLEAGVRAGEYVVERFLGAGAMGEVYAGIHPEIGKRVAIKVLKHALASSAEAAARFKREARVVNTIEHANVIDVFAFGQLEDGRMYLVMDLVDGKSLRAAVTDGPMDVATALDILDQIADALDAAHAKGIVHRDLKPDNVMLSGSPPKVHVLDFGIAKLLSTESSPNPATLLTGQGAWIGTPGYMAPEQWSADGAGPASDRYALGVMAFEMLSGKLPFQAPTLPQMMEQHFRAPVPALSTRGAVAARSMFDGVLARAMAKDPDKRYATARELVAALREASGKKLSRVVGPPRKMIMPALIGAGVLGVAVVGVVAVRGGPKERPQARRSGFVTVEVTSNPPRATVLRGDRMLGTTPFSLDLPNFEPLDLTFQKPGYATQSKHINSGEVRQVDIVLVQVSGFEGTWVFPDGQLRAFTRSGDDHVDVFKLESLNGEKVFYRKYALEEAPTGVKFASTETVIDQRAPAEPSCQVPVRVEYIYDPARDVLEVRPEDVETGFQNGRCVVHSRELAKPIALVRAEKTSDTRISRAPMGVPIDSPQLRTRDEKPTSKEDLLRQKDEEMKKALEQKKPTQQKKAPPKKASLIETGLDTGNAINAPPKQAKNAPPQPQAPPQQQSDDDEAQQARGDSQVAPPVKK
jgi:tRNA A-37 threonylcarbamoyl transferase component Bud32